MALFICSQMSPPPSKSRLSILQSAPDRSIKSNIRSAIQISFDEWLMKTVYCGFSDESFFRGFGFRFRAFSVINGRPFNVAALILLLNLKPRKEDALKHFRVPYLLEPPGRFFTADTAAR